MNTTIMTREEAIEVYHVLLNQKIKEAFEVFAPELKESEDEIHREWILEYLYDGLRKSDEQFKGQFKSAIAWLEKQSKEDERYKDLEELLAADDIYQMSMNDKMVNEAKVRAVNALSELCIGRLLGFEKQGEQKPKDKSKFKENEDERIRKDLIKYLEDDRDCQPCQDVSFYDSSIAWLEKQKEQRDYRKLYEDIAQSEWFKKAYVGKSLGEEFEQKEQKLNHDKEKLIKHCIGLILTDATEERFKNYGLTLKDCLTWLSVQEEQKSVILKPHKGDDTNPYDMGASEAQDYAISRGFGIPLIDGEVYVDERHLMQTIGNILRWADEHPKEQKPSINIIQLKSLMHQYLQEAANEKDDSDIEADTDKWARKILRYDFEQKPILEIFGFKVGDAVRLKDGDGRKHIIKSFKEVEGIHGPNFYQVEFEDNSARDGIYPGKEYPNGYYTQMEKLEKEQKPITINQDEKEFLADEITAFLCNYDKEFDGEDPVPSEVAEHFYLLGKQAQEQKPAEWSEEDRRKLNRIYDILGYAADDKGFLTSKRIIGDKEAIELQDFLKFLRPSWKPSEEQKPETKLTRWVARDENGEICAFEDYPEKDSEMWIGSNSMLLDRKSFPDLKWEDEPVEVEVTITKK